MASRSPRASVHEIIFGHETPAGKAFDVVLILLIVASVLIVMLESVQSIGVAYGPGLRLAEWVFTIVFTIEYVLRLWCAPSAAGYARSFFGIVDLLAILPTYLSLVIPGGQALLAVRALRLLRVFRVLKLAHYMSESAVLMRALRASRHKITVFIAGVLTLVVTLGSMMYLVEGGTNGFTSIPKSVYWAIVTLTTVGYGDIAPQTSVGQALAAVIMIMGYAIIAVPTGIVTVEIGAAVRQSATARTCPQCGLCRSRRGRRALQALWQQPFVKVIGRSVITMHECWCRFIRVGALATATIIAGCASEGLPPGVALHTAESLGLRFAYPDSFLVGRFANEALPPAAIAQGMEAPFRNAVVLVRPADLGSHALDSIPVGEIPVIWLDKSPAARLVFRLLQADSSYSLGELKISQFPGFPGPYGDEAFYYVVEFADGALVEIAAHRRDMRHPETATGFDAVIEAILPTLEQIGT